MSETAYKDGTCSECKGPLAKGAPIRFKKGARRDGSEVSIPIHEVCPKPGGDPALTQSKLPDTPQESSEHFVQISAWVPIEKAPAVLAAIREARGW